MIACERVAAAGAIAGGVLALSRFVAWPWPLELLSHFQVQYLAGALVAAGFLAVRRRWRWAGVALAMALVPAAAVVPLQWRSHHGWAYADQGATGAPLRILQVNVLSRNRRYGDVLALVESTDPDLAVFQEVNRKWMRALEPLQEAYPFQASGPREDNFGIAVLSRFPFRLQRVHTLGEAGLPTIHLELEVQGRSISLLATHPKPPLERRQFRLRNDQLEAVGALARELPRPLIVVGDLNTTMWSPWYREFCAANKLVNARRGFGVLASWPAAYPALGRVPIDHCLVSPQIAVTGCRLGPAIGSDHRPLITDLVVP